MPVSGDITEAFDALIRLLEDRGSPVRQHLRPGLSAATIGSSLRAAGLAPRADIEEWFGYLDGVDHKFHQGRPTQHADIFGGWTHSLARALERRSEFQRLARDAFRSDGFVMPQAEYQPGALPVATWKWRDGEVVVDLRFRGNPSRVAWEESDFEDPGPRYDGTLLRFIQRCREDIESGRFGVDESGEIVTAERMNRNPEDLARIYWLAYELGSLELMHPNELHRCMSAVYRHGATRVRLLGDPDGGVPQNRNMEWAQTENLRDRIVEYGFDPDRVELGRSEQQLRTDVHLVVVWADGSL